MVQEQTLPEPRPLEELLLCTVKAGTPDFIDRNFCFRVISPTSEHLFQALSESEVHQWISAIQVGGHPCMPGLWDFCFNYANHSYQQQEGIAEALKQADLSVSSPWVCLQNKHPWSNILSAITHNSLFPLFFLMFVCLSLSLSLSLSLPLSLFLPPSLSSPPYCIQTHSQPQINSKKKASQSLHETAVGEIVNDAMKKVIVVPGNKRCADCSSTGVCDRGIIKKTLGCVCLCVCVCIALRQSVLELYRIITSLCLALMLLC